jgi:hypothetical protein
MRMKFSIVTMITATASAFALSAQTEALAPVAPGLPPPFVGAPMNDDPRAGQFSLTFDDTGKLVSIGSVPMGIRPNNFPVFDLTPALAPLERAQAQADSTPQRTTATNVPKPPA